MLSRLKAQPIGTSGPAGRERSETVAGSGARQGGVRGGCGYPVDNAVEKPNVFVVNGVRWTREGLLVWAKEGAVADMLRRRDEHRAQAERIMAWRTSARGW